ncbi:PAS and ANTAR domain-containing protein [Mycobacterium conspicuum]|jgi:PAS domain S-box-containing protein|uniref:histidine kinase n=1 Tax=Mycobacterium conspicuum TaxID=44010 RepID=A0A1X1TJ33_9MYCO|nr:PAS and ANTAR domain-containing protein [Mycobacterium conspicuum]ORV44587.1 antitermination regulator [Mycobacterium conspicuum]BBZ37957.1 transcription antitermination regulator [Mycobacterium conspicuum]
MNFDFNGESADIEQALAGGAPQRVGWFRFYFADQRWEWSEQVERMHGYKPGSVTPTTELVLSHKHPDDRGQVAATIDEILNSHKPYSTRHRIIDTSGHTHQVVVAGDRLYDADGAVIGTHGVYVDISRLQDADYEERVAAKLAEIAENRAVIEQAKGMLMLIYGINDEGAFDLLKWLSQEANVKLRLLAERISEDLRSSGPAFIPQSEFDQLLLSARSRVGRPGGPALARK